MTHPDPATIGARPGAPITGPRTRLYSAVEHRVFGLDLMRTIAILAVLYVHTEYLLRRVGLPTLPLFDGVDLFFVLSGFLIGGILLRTLREHGASWRSVLAFWRRRWLRTLPNFYLFLAINLVVAWIAFPFAWESYDASFLVFAQNLIPFQANHAFFPEAWSLAVEEWFYLSTPLLMLLLARVRSSGAVATSVAVAAVAVIVVATWARALTFDPSMSTDFQAQDENVRKVVLLRLDTPAIGLLAALLKDRAPSLWRRGRLPLLLTGLALVASAVAWQQHVWTTAMTWAFSTFYPTVLACGFLCLLPVLDGWTTAPGRLAGFVTYTSIISYSLYLVHYSLLIGLAQRYLPTPSGVGAVVLFLSLWVAAYTLATLNYHFYESRFLAFRDRGRRRPPPPRS